MNDRGSGTFVIIDSPAEARVEGEPSQGQEKFEGAVSPTDFVKQLGFPVYKVINFNRDKIHIWVGGCNGTKADAQQNAEAMNKLVEDGLVERIDIAIDLGDKSYPSGFKSPDDKKFDNYYEAYANPRLSHIAKTPILWASGNHDAAREKDPTSVLKYYLPMTKSVLPSDINHEEIEMNQVLHTYDIHPGDPELDETKFQFYSRKKVDYTKLSKIVMSALAYSYIFNKLQIFIINSNNLVKDFYELIKHLVKSVDEENCKTDFLSLLKQLISDGKIDPLKNQVAWLFVECDKARKKGRTILFGQHHPWFTLGKRAYKSDADSFLYLDDDEMKKVDLLLKALQDSTEVGIEQLRTILILDMSELTKTFNIPALSSDYDNYNKTSKRICFLIKAIADLLVTAHDHNFYYYNNKNSDSEDQFCQLTNGTNDSECHERTYFGEQENVGAFTKNRTEVVLTVDVKNPQNKIEANVFIHRAQVIRHLKFFTDTGCHPVRHVESHPEDENPKMEKVREIVLVACKRYRDFLDDRQKQTYPVGAFYSRNTTHKTTQWMDEIMNLVNQYEPYEFNELCELIGGLKNKKSGNSLYRMIYELLKSEQEKEGEEKESEKLIDEEVFNKLCPIPIPIKLKSN